jgi:hypothetical protein
MTPLSPIEKLEAARKRYERQLAAERAEKMAADRAAYERQQAEFLERVPISDNLPFVYKPRTPEQWAARAQQGRRDSHRKWIPRARPRKR